MRIIIPMEMESGKELRGLVLEGGAMRGLFTAGILDERPRIAFSPQAYSMS